MSPVSTNNASRLPADRIALLSKIAMLYHEQGMRQPEIAERLHLSQSRVSRFLKEAVSLGVVRTVVVPPPGVFPDLESGLAERYGLSDAVVVDPYSNDEALLLRALGGAAAAYLETTLVSNELVGISSWSSTLLAAVDAMQARSSGTAKRVVQVLGGTGHAGAQAMATRMAERLSQVWGAEPVYLQAPGVVGSAAAREALLVDTNFTPIVEDWGRLTLLLVGIGAVQPSSLLQDSGNSLGEAELDRLRDLGAVGDVCLRFFDKNGAPLDSELDDRVIGISSDQLRAVPRKIGVAGGERKVEAIRAAVTGGWLDVLITDLATAKSLLD